jgi:CRISPR-associated endonuclease Cas1
MARETFVVDGISSLVVEGEDLVVRHGFPRGSQTRIIPRVEDDIKSIIVPSRNGSVTFEALNWLCNVGISFVSLYDGHPTCHSYNRKKPDPVTGKRPQADSDALLRRSQAFAVNHSYGVDITRYLLDVKLIGQRDIATDLGSRVDEDIDAERERLTSANLSTCRKIEGKAAKAYWSAWRSVAAQFSDVVPEHWRVFPKRESINAGNSPRQASDPVNALLNYGYGVLEGATVQACQTMGLDPLMGILHSDQNNRYSMAADLMEPGRPLVDQIVLDMIQSRTFKKADFAQSTSGVVRLKPDITKHLADVVHNAVPQLFPIWEDVLHIFILNQPRWDSRGDKYRTPLSRRNRIGRGAK